MPPAIERSTAGDRPLRGGWLRRGLAFVFSTLLMGSLWSGTTSVLSVGASSNTFSFNWTGTPSNPRPWVPEAQNDWDLFESSDTPSEVLPNGDTMDAAHGSDCSVPPAVHTVVRLVDTAFICNNHMMTAADDSHVYFTPAQLVDFSQGTATVTWQVSTARNTDRDWWEIWLAPFAENRVAPADVAPNFQGPPPNSVRVLMGGRRGCSQPQAYAPGAGTQFFYAVFRGGNQVQSGGGGDCMEDHLLGGPSGKVRTAFTLQVSQNHLLFYMSGSRNGNVVYVDETVNLNFNRAVLTFAHDSYDVDRCNSPCRNTWHWSDVAISPAIPFTMLRPNGVAMVHPAFHEYPATNTTVTLPQPAPVNAFLRFAAIGTIQVAYDAGAAQDPHSQDDGTGPGPTRNYFTPIPAGTQRVTFSGRGSGGWPWWVEDISVWALTAPVSLPAQTNPRPSQAPAPPSEAAATPKTPTQRSGAVHHPGGPFDGVSGAFWSAVHHVQDWSGQAVHTGQRWWSWLTRR